MSKTRDEHFVRTQEIIDKYGVMIQWVGAGDEEPCFAYTVGLARLDHPELIIFGLPPDTSRSILNGLAMPVVAGNARCQLGLNSEVLEGFDVMLIEVDDSSEHLTMANAMFAIPGQGPLDAMQIVFPDAKGRWPWGSGSEVATQPVLGSHDG